MFGDIIYSRFLKHRTYKIVIIVSWIYEKNINLFYFDTAGEDYILSEISGMSVHEAAAFSVNGTDSYFQEESDSYHWRHIYLQSSRWYWFSTVQSISRERFGEGTVERDPRPSEISSSQTKTAVLWRWEGGREEARLDAGSCRHRPDLCDRFQHLHHRRNSHFLHFIRRSFSSAMIAPIYVMQSVNYCVSVGWPERLLYWLRSAFAIFAFQMYKKLMQLSQFARCHTGYWRGT